MSCDREHGFGNESEIADVESPLDIVVACMVIRTSLSFGGFGRLLELKECWEPRFECAESLSQVFPLGLLFISHACTKFVSAA
jgi:hypothetical protein